MTLYQRSFVILPIYKDSTYCRIWGALHIRHSYATHMIDNGAPLEVIQSLLGHEKSETTRIYAHLSGKLRYDFYNKYF